MRATNRRATRALLLILLSFAGACSEDRPAPSAAGDAESAARPEAAADPNAPPARPRVVAFGDSLTAGLGLLEQEAYPALLQQRIDAAGYEVEVVNAGVSGDTSASAVRRLDWALEGDVRVVIVAFGGNDGLRGLPVSQLKENLSAVIAGARARGAVVILAGMEAPPNFGQEYAAAFRQAFREVAQRERVLFVPFLLEGVAGRSDLNQQDGIHPNRQGAAVIADTLWAVLQPLLDQIQAAA